jgi:beta-glucosidase
VVASRTRPVRELKGFQHVTIDAGEAKRVRFTLEREQLRFWGDDGWRIEAGMFHLWIASSSTGGEQQRFELV